MCQNKIIQIRLSDKQYNLIVNKKENFGYSTLSQFVRDSLLKDDLAVLMMLQEIHLMQDCN